MYFSIIYDDTFKGVFGLEVGNEMMILCNEMVMRKLCNENVMKMVFGLVWDVMKKIGCEIMKKGMQWLWLVEINIWVFLNCIGVELIIDNGNR